MPVPSYRYVFSGVILSLWYIWFLSRALANGSLGEREGTRGDDEGTIVHILTDVYFVILTLVYRYDVPARAPSLALSLVFSHHIIVLYTRVSSAIVSISHESRKSRFFGIGLHSRRSEQCEGLDTI